MKIDKIVQFKLIKSNLCFHEPDSRYWFDTLTVDTFDNNISKVEEVIYFHNQDLEWEGIPSVSEVKDRLEFGSQCHLHMYEDKCLGWHWTNPNCITIDWKSYYQNIKENELYIGGALVSRNYKPHPNSSWFFYRQGFEYSFNLTNTDTMYLYSDDWNRASAMLCYKSGFTKYNFLNEN